MKKIILFFKNVLFFIIEPFKFLYIKNSENSSSFLQKYSWMLYVVAFLMALTYIIVVHLI